jgi:hypothetical protein
MTPLTENPTLVILTGDNGELIKFATNVSPDLKVVLTSNPHDFNDEALGKPFQVTEPS